MSVAGVEERNTERSEKAKRLYLTILAKGGRMSLDALSQPARLNCGPAKIIQTFAAAIEDLKPELVDLVAASLQKTPAARILPTIQAGICPACGEPIELQFVRAGRVWWCFWCKVHWKESDYVEKESEQDG